MVLIEAVTEAVGLLQGFTAQKTADGELTDDEIETMIGELTAIIDALQYELECRQEAYGTASPAGERKLKI